MAVAVVVAVAVAVVKRTAFVVVAAVAPLSTHR